MPKIVPGPCATVIGLLLLGSAAAAPADVPGSRPPLTFRSGVEVVNLNLTALDARQRFVTDLTEREIAIYEDGVPQTVSLFSKEHLPLSLAILVDSSASMEPKLAVARTAARRLLASLKPEDEASVASFNQRIRLLEDYTTERPRLEAALGDITAEGATGLYSALYISLRECGRRGSVAELRRRAVVVLSDGEDTSSLVSDDQVLELARKSGVAVYAISLRPQVADLQAEQHRATYFMTRIAEDTGGRVFFPSGLADLDRVYARVAEELRTQYGVGYVSSNPHRDGRWRRIDIHTLRDSVLLRHRTGYYAPGRPGRDRQRAAARASAGGAP